MAAVTIQNQTFGLITIGLKNALNANLVDAVRLPPRGRLNGVANTRLTAYTEGLARKGLISLRSEIA
jgi:hypothetical protein